MRCGTLRARARRWLRSGLSTARGRRHGQSEASTPPVSRDQDGTCGARSDSEEGGEAQRRLPGRCAHVCGGVLCVCFAMSQLSKSAVLYSFFRSSASWRVRIGSRLNASLPSMTSLSYSPRPQGYPVRVSGCQPHGQGACMLGVRCNCNSITPLVLGQLRDSFKEISPQQEIPVLLIDGLKLTQSVSAFRT